MLSILRRPGVLIRASGVSACLLALTACTAPSPMAGPETIAAGPTTITVRAGGWTDPIEYAQDHCAQYGRTAVLVGQSRIDDYEVEDLFVYDCIEQE